MTWASVLVDGNRWVAKIFKTEPDAKMLVIIGNDHVLKKLEWQDHAVEKT